MREHLKAARIAANMTQQQTADYLGISLRAYQGIEWGTTLGSIKHWDKLEDLFGIPQRRLRVVGTPDEVVKGNIKDISKVN